MSTAMSSCSSVSSSSDYLPAAMLDQAYRLVAVNNQGDAFPAADSRNASKAHLSLIARCSALAEGIKVDGEPTADRGDSSKIEQLASKDLLVEIHGDALDDEHGEARFVESPQPALPLRSVQSGRLRCT